MKRPLLGLVIASLALSVLALTPGRSLAQAGTVKITPLGSRTGDLCAWDVALLFEDPTCVRILYDPGLTVAGASDSRLGDVHAVLVTHNHSDHIGGFKLNQDPNDPEADCRFNTLYSTLTFNTNAAEIAAGKNSAVIVGRSMDAFLRGKIGNITPVVDCPLVGPTNQIVVPRSQPCTTRLAFGAQRMVTNGSNGPGVRVAAVAALHGDEIQRYLLTDSLATPLGENSLFGYDGLAIGYVLRFTNGLTVYLSGDSGPTSDMRTIVRDFYQANLAVVNIDGQFQMGPEEAAFVVRELVQPAAVIPAHTAEVSTTNGQVNPGTRLAHFIELIGDDVPVHVPLSGGTMAFDGSANCVAGCAGSAARVPSAPQAPRERRSSRPSR